jgi:hypothetical protein
MIAVIDPSVQKPGLPASGDDQPLFEIIDGQRVELIPKSILGNGVVSKIGGQLGSHVLDNRTGEIVLKMLFHLPLPADRYRRPDVAFVSAKTIANAPPQPGSDNA